MYQLVIAKGRHQGKSVKLKHFPFIIGRQKDCSLRAVSMEISRQHCAIESDGDQVWVKDLGSTNGVLINNQKISGTQELHDSDLLQIGPLTLQFKSAATADSQSGLSAQPAIDESTPMPAAYADMDEDAAATLLMNLEDLQAAEPAKAAKSQPEPAGQANAAQSILERYKKK